MLAVTSMDHLSQMNITSQQKKEILLLFHSNHICVTSSSTETFLFIGPLYTRKLKTSFCTASTTLAGDLNRRMEWPIFGHTTPQKGCKDRKKKKPTTNEQRIFHLSQKHCYTAVKYYFKTQCQIVCTMRFQRVSKILTPRRMLQKT